MGALREALLAMAMAPATMVVAAFAVDAGDALGRAVGWASDSAINPGWDLATQEGVTMFLSAAVLGVSVVLTNVWAIARPGGASIGTLFGVTGGFSFHAPSFAANGGPAWLWALFLSTLFLAPLAVVIGLRLARPYMQRRQEAILKLRTR